MSKPIHVEIFKEARALIGDEAKWCRGEIALDQDGMPVCATDHTANKWCAYGALVVSAYHMTRDTNRAFDLSDAAVTPLGGCDELMRVNDTKGHSTVVALFDEILQTLSSAY